MVSAPGWVGTGCEFDSWLCQIYIYIIYIYIYIYIYNYIYIYIYIYIYPMFIEPTITWVLSGLPGYYYYYY